MSQVVSSIAAVDDQSYLVSRGIIIFPIQTMLSLIREILENYRRLFSLIPPKMGIIMTPVVF